MDEPDVGTEPFPFGSDASNQSRHPEICVGRKGALSDIDISIAASELIGAPLQLRKPIA